MMKQRDQILPEHRLHIDNSFGISHVVLLSTHCALFIHNNQIIGIDDATLQQAVQTETHTRTTMSIRTEETCLEH